MMTERIQSYLAPDHPWANRIRYFPVLSSTNDLLKELALQGAPEGTAVIAGRQTNGHGRLGRSFHSPEGMGLYLSVLLRPECPPVELMHLTCAAAVAACDAVEAVCGFRPGIKWTNDLVHDRRKLGGILTELRLTPKAMTEFAIIGIGINCRQKPGDFPEDIRQIAGSLGTVTGSAPEPAMLAASLITALETVNRQLSCKAPLLDRYRRDCVTLGQQISIVRGSDIRHGTALDIDSDGALVVLYEDGTQGSVSSGEVSIRGMYGYI